jgi:septal ring factor EnvC (AmiA/AmiB activator)
LPRVLIPGGRIMAQYYGMTAEMYQAVAALVDDRMKGILVTRQDFDRLVEAQARTEERLNRLAEAQARTEERLNQLAEAQARTEERMEEVAVALQDLATVQKEMAAILECFERRPSLTRYCYSRTGEPCSGKRPWKRP